MQRTYHEGRYSGTLYPSGFFSIGAIPRKRKRRDITTADIPEYSRYEMRYLQSKVYDDKGNLIHESSTPYFYDLVKERPTPVLHPLMVSDLYSLLRPQSSEAYPLRVDGGEAGDNISLPEGEASRQEDTPNIGLSSIPRCRKAAREGLKGITNYGKRMINEGCYVLKQLIGIRNLGLYTLTCPYTQDNLVEEFAKNWSVIVKRFLERVKRMYESRGAIFYYVAAIELQERRYERCGQVCPHLHYIAQCRNGTGKFIASANELRAIWSDVCFNAVGTVAEVGASLDCVVVRKDPSAYLAKYMSKGGRIVAEVAERTPHLLPKRWWSMSTNLRKTIKTFSLKLSGSKADVLWFINTNDEYHAKLVWSSKVFATLASSGEVCIGYCGQLTSEMVFFFNPNVKNLALL